MPHAPQLDADPPPPLGAIVSTAPGHTLWGVLPPSPVDQAAAGSLPYHWSLTAPTIPPSVGDIGSYDQLHAGFVHHNTHASLPTPPLFTGAEAHSYAGFPFVHSDGGCSPLTGEQPVDGPGAPDDPGTYLPLLQGPGDATLLRNPADSKFDQVEGYCASTAVFDSYHAPTLRPTANGNPPAQLNIGGLERCGLYAQTAEQLGGGGWIKEEGLAPANGARGEPIPAGLLMNVPHADLVEGPSKPITGLEDEGAHDRKKRGKFNERLRSETSKTRQIGACMRCHNQRLRCVPNEGDPTNPLAPCVTCLKVHRNSKKTIHFTPCLRFKVTSMVVYRAGGLGYTERFDHTKVVDVVDYSDGVIYNIEITQGLCQSPMLLQVRRFRPRQTDKTHWRYHIDDGARAHKSQDTGAFCLADIEETAKKFNDYIDSNAVEGLAEAVKGSDDIVKEVFAMIETHCNSLPLAKKTKVGQGAKGAKKQPDQREFLRKMVRLWFAIRHGTGSAWLCGNERLGLSPILEPNHPFRGRVLVSRMIVAQFDSIRHEFIYKKLAPDVLRTIDAFLASSNKEAWFTVFLATFLLLHLAACTSQDRHRHAKQNSRGKRLDTRYGNLHDPLTRFVEEVHYGAVMLLAHWQYFKRCDLMTFNWDNVGESALTSLEAEQIDCVKRVVARLKERLPSIPTTPAGGCWEHELFWVSKMFVSGPSSKADWTPPEIFTRAKPSVGRE
ncbi:uncharacterized protein B0H64DRAFT_320431 [Chaetomium fimeti]|uniref:Zn(2)-C6 fungal-type domain-containing protein n=1 Tax=Chaetomium fimeti TaxID=1854472 RepID=A0AAE0HIM5_9PEZI|nr:hypothetical protein B0H64DRAFT_320431 [Chaetomium fimeti]